MNPTFQRYAITDRFQISSNRETSSPVQGEEERQAALVRQATRLASEGVGYLQLREKDLPAEDLAALARRLLDVLRGSATRLLINSRVDIAIATSAHGVHLTSSLDELTPQQIHDLFAMANLAEPVVTVSCHTLADVMRHRLEPVTALLFGPVFEKMISGRSNVEGSRLEGVGLRLLQEACEAAAPVPVFALGGVTPANTAACIDAGACGLAAIRLFSGE